MDSWGDTPCTIQVYSLGTVYLLFPQTSNVFFLNLILDDDFAIYFTEKVEAPHIYELPSFLISSVFPHHSDWLAHSPV